MKIKLIVPIVLLFVFSISTFAQKFITPLNGFSKKKTSYIYKTGGDEVKCNLSSLKWKKGLIEEIKVKDLEGKKVKISPSEIEYMYIPPSKLAKYAALDDILNDVSKWDNKDLNQEVIAKGYVYHEKSLVKVKKKSMDAMLQLLNPSFSSKIKVYNDPYAGETASIGVGGITVAGGLAKSYYIKKEGEKAAYKLQKKNYTEEFERLFSDCPELIEKYKGKAKWSDFEAHIYDYTQFMSK